MGKNRRKKRNRPGARNTRAVAGSSARKKLAQAVRSGEAGDSAAAVRLARKALRGARSGAEKKEAARVLAEALLQDALCADSPATTLSRLDEALRLDPDSARIAFHHALVLLSLGSSERGASALVRSLASGGESVAGSADGCARQLLRLVQGRRWSREGLTETEVGELRLIEALLPSTPNGAGPAPDARIHQLRLFPVADGEPGAVGPAAGAHPSSEPVWQDLLALTSSAGSAGAQALADAAADEALPLHTRARLRYYQGVAAHRRGDGRAGEHWQWAARAGLDTPWLATNLGGLLREEAVALAEEGRWPEVVALAARVPAGLDDRILSETLALANDHLGHAAALAGHWADAAEHWRAAEALHPRRALARNLALAEEALGNWSEAAEAWRAMARRRPRRADHPDALTDGQVAELWSRAARCYRRAVADDDYDWERDRDPEAEALTCIETALRYAPEDRELRVRRAEHLMAADELDAAAEELDRVLAAAPSHDLALRLRAHVEEQQPFGDPEPFWRQILDVTPNDGEARESLAAHYLRWVARPRKGTPGFRKPRPRRQQIRYLEEALEVVPGHPGLLLRLGIVLRTDRKYARARAVLGSALDHASDDIALLGQILHELAHTARGDSRALDDVVARIREHPRAGLGFWVVQADDALDCQLPASWFELFVEEGLAAAERPGATESRATALCAAHSVAAKHDEAALVRRIEERVREEVPGSGAVELLAAVRLLDEDGDEGEIKRLVREARRLARRAGESALLEMIALLEERIAEVRTFMRFLADFE